MVYQSTIAVTSVVISDDKCDILDSLPDLKRKLPPDIFIILFYVAGYVGRSNDEIHDAYFYYEIYGNYLKVMNPGGAKIFGDIICQLAIYSYIIFHEASKLYCCSTFCNILMLISEMFGFDIKRHHGMILSNIMFKNVLQNAFSKVLVRT